MSFDPEPLFRRAMALAVGLLVFNEALGGALRYGLAAIDGFGLSYAAFLLTALVILAYAGLHALSLKSDAAISFMMALGGFYALVGLVHGQSAAQMAFGLYTWVPFFLGVLVFRLEEPMISGRTLSWLLVLWTTGVGGVFLSALVPFPWVGGSISVLGVDRDLARDWDTFGLARLPGFARASFSAANEILLAASLLWRVPMRRLTRVAFWAATALAILLTTSKAPLAGWIVIPALLSVYDARRRRHRSVAGLTRSVYGVGLALVVLPPLACAAGLRIDAGGSLGFFSLATVASRFDDMWPRAFALLQTPAQCFLGTGFGGIGVSQTIFDPQHFSAGDNLFVFLWVTIGLAAIPILWAVWIGDRRFLAEDPERHRLGFALSLFLLCNGTMANGIEGVLPCLSLGWVVGKALRYGFGRAEIPSRTRVPDADWLVQG